MQVKGVLYLSGVCLERKKFTKFVINFVGARSTVVKLGTCLQAVVGSIPVQTKWRVNIGLVPLSKLRKINKFQINKQINE